ncbi:cell wall integrity and stress response component [Microdochium nivale]|nr:cell wall integrity and stress response component [Microdochium nivale]
MRLLESTHFTRPRPTGNNASLLPIAALLLLATTHVAAQTVQDLWTFPKGPDVSTIINVNQKVKIGWTADLAKRFSDNCPGCLPTAANLYITSYGISGQLPFKHQIASKVDVTSDLSIEWTVSLPETEVSCQGCGSWVFRFMADGSAGDVSSAVFLVKPARPGSSPDTTTAATSSAAQSTTSTSTPPTNVPIVAAPIPTSQPPSSSSSTAPPSNSDAAPPPPGMSAAAKAGMGVGVAAGAILLFLLGWFLASWYKRRRAAEAEDGVRDVIATTYLEVAPGGLTSRMSRSGAASPSIAGPLAVTPRHRPLVIPGTGADEKGGGGGGNWDPKDSFYKPPVASTTTTATAVSVRSQGSVPDFLGMPHTPDSPSFELLPRSGPRS